jgi:hypothetical protein
MERMYERVSNDRVWEYIKRKIQFDDVQIYLESPNLIPIAIFIFENFDFIIKKSEIISENMKSRQYTEIDEEYLIMNDIKIYIKWIGVYICIGDIIWAYVDIEMFPFIEGIRENKFLSLLLASVKNNKKGE